MAATLVHRGPDDAGTWCDPAGQLALAFRRLSILDLSPAGHQPMASRSGRFVTVFNGEIYNHLALRDHLRAAGAVFTGGSDTETLLAGFETWGIRETLTRLQGMFAIAVWDGTRRELSLACDRLGKKPLYLYRAAGVVAFASEIRALRRTPGFTATVNPDGLDQFLRFLYVPAPHSIYREITKLPPGHLVTIADPGDPNLQPTPYWTLSEAVARGRSTPWRGSETEAVNALEELLGDAVQGRLLADVPVGALLSGGIDSSAVVALMCRHWPGQVRTYSVRFAEADFDEADHAEAIARHLGTTHTTFPLSADDLLAVVPRLPEIFDEPLADPSQVPTYLICALARRDVTVALTGDGGDEVFGGYNRYTRGAPILRGAMATPYPLRRALAGVVARPGLFALARRLGIGGTQQSPATRADKVHRLLSARSAAAMYAELLAVPGVRDELVTGYRQAGGSPTFDTLSTSEPRFPTPDPFHAGLAPAEAMMLSDQGRYLPGDLLAKLDRASMAASLEARCPLLDHRVVEFAWRLPLSLKIRGGTGKWILRALLERHVPRALFERPKMGFTAPIAAWLRGPLRSWAEELMNDSSMVHRSALHHPEAQRIWRTFVHDEHDALAGLVWAMVFYRAWEARWEAGTGVSA